MSDISIHGFDKTLSKDVLEENLSALAYEFSDFKKESEEKFKRIENKIVNEIKDNGVGKSDKVACATENKVRRMEARFKGSQDKNCEQNKLTCDLSNYIKNGIFDAVESGMRGGVVNDNGSIMVPYDDINANLLSNTFEGLTRKIKTKAFNIGILRCDGLDRAMWVDETNKDDYINAINKSKVDPINIKLYNVFKAIRLSRNYVESVAEDNVNEIIVSQVIGAISDESDRAFLFGSGEDRGPVGILSEAVVNSIGDRLVKLEKNGISENAFFNMINLKSKYLSNAKWVVGRSGFEIMRKLKNQDGGRYFAYESVNGNIINTFLGFPIVVVDKMEEAHVIDEHKPTVMFGDFNEAYATVVHESGYEMIVDRSFSPLIEIRMNIVKGGAPVDMNAVNILSIKS